MKGQERKQLIEAMGKVPPHVNSDAQAVALIVAAIEAYDAILIERRKPPAGMARCHIHGVTYPERGFCLMCLSEPMM